MSETKFSSWSAVESPVTIEYSMVVVEEMRHAVAEGFQRLSRGGIEVGGVLYGTRDDRTVRILAMRPIACEHARGPAFLLSDKDRKVLNEQLAADAQDPHLDGLISLGWFLSHTRSDIALSDSDLELYSIFFPAPWQVTLVVRPGRGGTMRAGFFVREADGSVKSDQSYLEFGFPDRLAGMMERGAVPRGERQAGERQAASERRLSTISKSDGPRPEAIPSFSPAAVEIAPPSFGQPQYLPSPPPKRKWPWLVGWALLVLIAVVFGLRYWMQRPVAEPISLAVIERDGQLRIEWNHAARPVVAAVRGTMVINDGSNTQTYALSPRELTAGSYTYARKTGDVEVRMSVEDSEGGKVQEASRFLGQPPVKADSGEMEDLKKKRDELQAQVDKLTQENRFREEKIQQLQRTVQIMQARSAK